LILDRVGPRRQIRNPQSEDGRVVQGRLARPPRRESGRSREAGGAEQERLAREAQGDAGRAPPVTASEAAAGLGKRGDPAARRTFYF